MIGKLDRYVGRIVLGAFVAAMVFFAFLSVLMHLLNTLGKFETYATREKLSAFEMVLRMLGYYARMVPVIVTSVTPFAVVTAAMFTVARLQHANEVVPMLFVGRSVRRILTPVMLLGLCAGLGMAACWEWVVPRFGAAIASIDSGFRHGGTEQKLIVHEQRGDESQFFRVLSFQPQTNTLREVALLQHGALANDTQLITATEAKWDPQRGDWELVVDGQCARPRSTSDGVERVDYEPWQWLGRPDLTPEFLMQQSRDSIDPELLGYSDLYAMVTARPNRAEIRLELHRHITQPLSCLVLLLLTLPLAIYYERGSRIERLLGAIGMCAGYLLLDLTCQSLAQTVTPSGQPFVHPVVAAWTPTIVFGSLGVVLYGSART